MTTALQVSLYGLVMLSSGMLAYAEGASFPDAFTIPLAILALFLTERWKLFWLRVRWANVLGLVAFGLAGWELSSGKIEARLLSLAHLLVYLTWIVLFMSKTSRMYWILCTMAILHVAVGAPQTSSGGFGLMCCVFLVGAIWTLTLFTLSRARQRYAEEDQVLLATSHDSSQAENGESNAGPSQANTFVWNQRSQPISTVQIDPRLRWINGPFVWGVLANVLLSSIVGALFFLFTPRIWVGSFSAFGESPDQPLRILQSGFAEEVQLGDIGQILEGTQTVLEVRMFDQASDQPINIVAHAERLGFDEPLFRGSVLGEYAKGKWRVGTTGRNDGRRIVSPMPAANESVRQEFRVEPMDSGILFAMPQHTAGRLEHRLSLISERRLTAVLYRDDAISGREQLKYTIYSEKPRSEDDRPFPRGTHISQMYRSEVDYYRKLPEHGLERMQALARQIAQPPDAATATPTEMARRIVHHLRDSGEFGYTLDMSVDDPTIDAVEDFLFNRKQGHCEYFASALALMLRAVGIPARLVSGFKGGDVNASTGYFVVQGRHAHVWVEALIEGRWRILDATPASRSDSVKSLAPKTSVFRQVANLFTDLWSHHIVGLSFNEQSDSFYTPLRKLGAEAIESLQAKINGLLTGDFSQKNGAETEPSLYDTFLSMFPVILLLCLLGVGYSLLTGRLRMTTWNRFSKLLSWLIPADDGASDGRSWRSRWSRWWSGLLRRLSGESAEQRLRVEFYERFLQLFRSSGLEPLPAQTAREFVFATQPAWSERLAAQELAVIPAEVVAKFYRVRYGGESLSLDELRHVNAQLSRLEQQWHRQNGQP